MNMSFREIYIVLILVLVVSCQGSYNTYNFNFDPNDLEDVLKFPTTRIFEIIPNEKMESKIEIEKGNEKNYNRSDYIIGTKDGWTYTIRNNKMTVKAEIKNDSLHGRYWSFFDSGEFRSMGTYTNGRKSNLWIQFYPDGQQANYGKWFNGEMIGLWIFFHKEGYIMEERIYKNSTNYDFKRKDVLGNIVIEGTYLDDLKSGEWKEFSAKGDLISKANYLNGKLEGTFEKWESDGRYIIAQFKGNKMHGPSKIFDQNMDLINHSIFENDSIVLTHKQPQGL